MRLRILALATTITLLCSALPALAYDCELDTIIRNGKQVGTVVVNGLDNYCGTVYFQGGGYSVHLDGQPKKFYSRDYAYKDVLNYMCDACLYKKKDKLSGQE